MAENLMITVIDKDTHARYLVTGQQIALSTQSIVELPLSQSQIKSLVRHGDALVVTTLDGQVIVFHGFFRGGQASDLATLDGFHGESVIAQIDWSDGSMVKTSADQLSLPVDLEGSYLFFDPNSDPATATTASETDTTAPATDTAPTSSASVDFGADASSADAGTGTGAVGTNTGTGAGIGAGADANSFAWLPLAVAGAGIAATVGGSRASSIPDTPPPPPPPAGPPAPPVIGAVTNNPDGTCTVTGTAQAGSTVTVTYPDDTTASAVVGSDGHYSIVSATAQTTITQVVATGADLQASAPTPFTPPEPPAQPIITSIGENPDGTITVNGTAAAGSLVTIVFPDSTSAVAIAGSDGGYSISSSAPEPNGTVSVSAILGGSSPSASATTAYDQPPGPVALTAISPDNGPSDSDFITNVGALTYTGTVSQATDGGQAVQISLDGGKTWHDATVTGTTWTYDGTGSPLASGDTQVVVRETDGAGATLGTWVQTVTIASAAPTGVATVTSVSATEISGTLGAARSASAISDLVQVSTDGGETWHNATLDSNGVNWIYMPATPLVNGAYSIGVRVADTAGNVGQAVIEQKDVTDGVAPPAPPAPDQTAALSAISPDTGAPGDFITNKAQLTFAGTISAPLKAGQQVQVSLDGVKWEAATVGADGLTWTYDNTTNTLPDDNYTVQARVVDTSSNLVGTVTNSTVPVTVDTTAPAETITINATSADGLTFSGTLSAPLNAGGGSREELQIRIDGGPWQTVPSGDIANGTQWSYNVGGAALGEGSHSVQARVVDVAGNESQPVTQAVQVGGGGGGEPPQPEIPTAAFASINPDTGTPGDFITSSSALILTGTVSAALGATQQLQIKIDDGGWQTAPASAVIGTSWSYAPSGLAEGSHTVQVQVLDTTSNQTSTPSAVQTLVIDTIKPAETVTINPTSADGLTVTGTLSAELNQSGSHEALQISTNGTDWQTVPANNVTGANWSYTFATALPEGDHQLQARVVDVAGNEGPLATQAVHVGGSGGTPTAPTQTAALTAISPDTGTPGDFITDQGQLTFSGTLSAALTAGQEVQISLNGGSWKTATVGADGLTWTYGDTASTLDDGSYTVQMRVYDTGTQLAGTVTDNTVPVLVDTAPPEETVTIDATSADGLTFGGTLSAPLNAGGGSTEILQISTDGGGNWQTVQSQDIDGTHWTYISSGAALANGGKVQAQVVDVAGNKGALAEQTVQVGGGEPPLPDIPTATFASISPDTGASGSDFITNKTDLTFTGTLSAALGATQKLQIKIDSGDWQDVPVTGTDWSYAPSGLTAGSHTVQVQVLDTSTSQTSAPASQTVVIDTTVPAETVTINPTSADFQTIGGTLSAPLNPGSDGQSAEQLQIQLDGGAWQTVPASDITDGANGLEWSCRVTMTTDAPSHRTVHVRVVDLAGNESQTVTQSVKMGVGTTIPTAAFDSISPDNGASSSDFITNSADLTFTGTLSAGLGENQKLQIKIYDLPVVPDGTETGDSDDWQDVPASAVIGTNWSYVPSGLTAGSYVVQVRVLDSSDNQTSAPALRTVLIDTTTPAEIVTINATSADGQTLSGTLSAPLHPYPGTRSESIEQLQIKIDGGEWQTVIAGPGSDTDWSYDVGGTPLGAGSHNVQARVVDVAGNASEPVTQAVEVSGGGESPVPDIPTATFASVSPDAGTPGDFITNSADLTFTGTVGAALGENQQLQIRIDSGEWQDVPANAVTGTSWSYAPSGLTAGSHTVQVQVLDTSTSQTSAPASQTVVIDTTTPAEIVTINATSADGLTIGGTLSAPLNPGSDGASAEQLQIKIDDGAWQTVPASDITDGATGLEWSYIVALDEGSHSVQARVVDVAGNESQPVTQTVEVSGGGEPPPPGIPTATFASIDPDNGTNSSDFITNTTDLTFKGTLSAALQESQKLQVKIDNGGWQDVPEGTVTGTGWSYVTSGLTAGSHTVQVQVLDSSDNQTSTPSAERTVVIDTTTPAETVTINATSDDGQTLSGTLSAALNPGSGSESAEQLQIKIGDDDWQTVTPNGTDWSYTSGTALGEGEHNVQARVVDVAGNEGASITTPVNVTGGGQGGDTETAPTQKAELTAISPDNGSSGSDFITDVKAITLSGTLDAALTSGQELQINILGGDHWETVPDPSINGNTWSYDASALDLPDGSYTVQLRVFDGGTEKPGAVTTSSKPVVIDTEAPVVSENAISIAASSNGTTFTGTVDPTALSSDNGSAKELQLSFNDGSDWQSVPIADISGGNWTYTREEALDAGAHPVKARIGDVAGNAGAPVTTQEVQVSGTGAPEITDPTQQVQNIQISADGLTLSGTLSAPLNQGTDGSAEEVLLIGINGGEPQPVASTNINGTTWSYTLSAPLTGSVTVHAAVQDRAGNQGPMATETVTVTGGGGGWQSQSPGGGEPTQPDIPTTATFTGIDPDTGTSGDFITNSAGLTFKGTLSAPLEATQKLQIRIDGDEQDVPASAITGTDWSYAPSGLTAGSHTVQVRVSNSDSSQTSAPSAPQTVVIDTTAPTETVTINATGTDLTISGTLSAALNAGSGGQSAEQLQVKIDGGEWQTVPSGEITNGADGLEWSYIGGAALDEGSHSVQARVVDAAGNASEPVTQTVEVSGGGGTGGQDDGGTGRPGGQDGGSEPSSPVDPSLPTVTLDSINPSTGANNNLIFAGTVSTALTDSEVVKISLDNGQTWATVPAAKVIGTNWTYTYSGTALAEGAHKVQVQVVDTGSSGGGAVVTKTLTVDTQAPTQQIQDLAVSSDGLTISGTLSAPLNSDGGSPEQLYVNINGTWLTVPPDNIDSSNHWSLTLDKDQALPNGTGVQALVVDAVGHRGPTESLIVGSSGGSSAPINVTSLSISPDTGVSGADLVTQTLSGQSPVISGTLSQPLPGNHFVLVSLDGGSTWRGATSASGTNWSFSDTRQMNWPMVPDNSTGTYQIMAVVINDKGSAVGPMASQQVVFDNRSFENSTATLTLVMPDNLSGTYDSSTLPAWISAVQSKSFVTGANTGLTFMGTASANTASGYAAMPGDYVEVSLDGGTTWVAATTLGVAPDGSSIYWSYTDTSRLSDGNVAVLARLNSVSGIVSGPLAAGTVTIDTHTPGLTSTITGVAGGTATSDGFTSDTGALVISGTLSGKLGSDGDISTQSVQVSLDGGTTWLGAIVDASGLAWGLTAPTVLAPDTYDVMTRVVNAAGTPGQSTSQHIVVTGAASPVTLAPVQGVQGSYNTDLAYGMSVTNQNKPTLTANTGALGGGQKVQFSVDDSGTWVDGTPNADRTQWTFTSTTALADGRHTASARVVNGSGSAIGSVQEGFMVDTVVPAETVNLLAISGTNAPGDFVTSAGTGLVFSGIITGTPTGGSPTMALTSNTFSTEQVQVSLDGGDWQIANAQMISSSGFAQWAYGYTGSALSNGVHTLQMRVADGAGNTSQTTTQTFVVDTQTTYPETVSITSISPDNGLNAADFITSARQLTFNGTVSQPLGAGEAVEVSLDNGAHWQTATVTGTTWSYANPSALADGDYSVLARVVDAGGNAQSAVAMQAVTVDNTPPAATTSIAAVIGGGGGQLAPTTDGSLMGWLNNNAVDVVAQIHNGGGGYLGADGGSPQSVMFTLNGGSTVGPASSVMGNGTGAQYITNLANGIYVAMALVEDAAGNAGAVSKGQAFGVYSGGDMNLNLMGIAQVAGATGRQVEISASSNVTDITLAEGVGSGEKQWSKTDTTNIGGVTFDVYHNAQAANTTADLLVEAGKITVHG